MFWGHLEIVKYLRERGANIEARDDFGNTALIQASFKGRFEVVKYLIEKGANIDKKNTNGETALTLARTHEIRDYIKSMNK